MKSILLVKKLLGLVEMTSGLVNASFSLPEWQAVKMIFSAPCPVTKTSEITLTDDHDDLEADVQDQQKCQLGVLAIFTNQPHRNHVHQT